MLNASYADDPQRRQYDGVITVVAIPEVQTYVWATVLFVFSARTWMH